MTRSLFIPLRIAALLAVGSVGCGARTTLLEGGGAGGGDRATTSSAPANADTSGAGAAGSTGAGGASCGVVTLEGPGPTLPFTLAFASGNLYGLVYSVGDASLAGDLNRIPIDGGPAAPLGGQYDGITLAVDATHAYFSDSFGSIYARSIGGGATTTLTLDDDAPEILVASGGDLLYAGLGEGPIKRLSKAGGAPTILVSGYSGEVLEMKTDATSLYWTELASDLLGGPVRKAPLTGGPATELPNTTGAVRLALSGDRLYFADSVQDDEELDGNVFWMPTDGSAPPVKIASAQGRVEALVAEKGRLFWVAGDFVSTIHVFDEATGAVSLAGTPPVDEIAVVGCDGGVCWSDGTSTSVLRYACSD